MQYGGFVKIRIGDGKVGDGFFIYRGYFICLKEVVH